MISELSVPPCLSGEPSSPLGVFASPRESFRSTVPPSHVRFSLPPADLDLFAVLPAKVRRLVHRRLRAMRVIHKARNPWAGCETVAAACASERGWSAKTLHALYRSFLESGGDWKTLVDRAQAGPAWQNHLLPAGLPERFVDWLAQLWTQNQRDKFASVHTRLISQYRRWQAGDPAAAIPGYDSCPPQDPGSPADLPAGWTYGNLKAAVETRADDFARKLVQIGPKAASQLGPQLLTTRVGLPVGSYYVPDDSWNDFKVAAFAQSCRLLSFHFLDLPSGCNVTRGHKPALIDQETQIEQRLKEREMIWLLVKLLTTEGYHPRGCVIACEKATATIRKRERQILANTLGDIIQVHDGPAGGGPGIDGLFTGRAGGNPRWKAALESWFNLLRNRTADLLEFPGQTGSNSRINLPEGLAGTEKDTLALVKAVRAMAPEKAELMRLGLLPYTEAIFRLDAIIEVINCRTDHDLEGWRKAGHYIEEFRVNPRAPWTPTHRLLEYDPAERSAVAAYISNTPGLRRERPLSPREVFDAGREHLVKLPLAVAALLIDEMPGKEITVANNALAIEDPDLDPDEATVFGHARRNGAGTNEPLRNGEKFLCRVNPLDPRVAWLYAADGKFAGVVPFYARASKLDTHALHQAFARKRQALAPLIEEGRRLAANITQDAIARTEANIALLGSVKTAADRERARHLRQFHHNPEAADEILAPATPAASGDAPADNSDDFLSAISQQTNP